MEPRGYMVADFHEAGGLPSSAVGGTLRDGVGLAITSSVVQQRGRQAPTVPMAGSGASTTLVQAACSPGMALPAVSA